MTEKRYNYVYITTNLLNNKQYVGDHSTNKLNDHYLGSGKLLYYSIKKYGKQNFKKEILEYFPTKKQSFDAQEKWITKYDTCQNGYNISPLGGMGVVGCHSEETKKIMSVKAKARPSPNKGKTFSDEHRKHIGESRKGKLHSEESKRKISKGGIGKRKGIPLSDEARKNMSIALIGKPLSEKQLEGRKHIKKTICPYCGNSYIPQHYNRSHGNKCKQHINGTLNK